MKKMPVRENKVPIYKRFSFKIVLLALFLICGYGLVTAASEYVLIVANPPGGDPPLTVTFSTDIQSSHGEVTRYMWSLGGGERREESTFSHTYTEEGEYRVNLMVEYEDGTAEYAEPFRITVGSPPVTAAPVFTPRATRTPTSEPTPSPTTTSSSTLPSSLNRSETSSPAPTPSRTAAPASSSSETAPTQAAPKSDTEARWEEHQNRVTVDAVVVTNDNPDYPVTISISLIEGTMPLVVLFAAQDVGSAENPPVSYAWNYGDKSFGGGSEPRHIYSSSGIYSPFVRIGFSDGHDEYFELPDIKVFNKDGVLETPLPTPVPSESAPIVDEPTSTVEEKTDSSAPVPTSTPAPTAARVIIEEDDKKSPLPTIITNDNPAYPVTISLSVVEGTKPLVVVFNVQEAGTAEITPTSYSWNFGDKSSGGGASPRHIYSDAGTFSPKVMIGFSDRHDEIISLPKIQVSN